jgi:hypothetical protein
MIEITEECLLVGRSAHRIHPRRTPEPVADISMKNTCSTDTDLFTFAGTR